MDSRERLPRFALGMLIVCGLLCVAGSAIAYGQAASTQRPNIVMLMTDDTGWNDFGVYSGGGAGLGHATPNIDRFAKEGAYFTSWYGQASCTAGRASFMTGRYPIRTALSVVVAPGDRNHITNDTPTIAQFFKQNGYTTYFSGKWHLGDIQEAYPIAVGFDEMKEFAAYYPGVYTYSYTNEWFHPWFPSYNQEFNKLYFSVVNMYEWEGTAGSRQPRSPRLPGITCPLLMFAKLIPRLTTSSSTPRAASHSSWM